MAKRSEPALPLPPIDWSRIEVPSGRVTFGQICAEEKLFEDADCYRDITLYDFGIWLVAITEKTLAERAFARELGLPDPHPDMTPRRGCIEELNDEYVRYGLSSGPKASLEMIKKMEADAAKQASEFLGRRP